MKANCSLGTIQFDKIEVSCKIDVHLEEKANKERKITKSTLTSACESLIITKSLNIKLTAIEMRFLKKIEGRTRRDEKKM